MVQEMAREFAEKVLSPDVLTRDACPEFQRGLYVKILEQGFPGMIFPEELGGGGLDMASFCMSLLEIASVDAGMAYSIAAQSLLCGRLLQLVDTGKALSVLLRQLEEGLILGAAISLELDSTVCIHDDNEFVLQGNKSMIPLGGCCNSWLVLARLEDGQPALVLVDRHLSGVRADSIRLTGLHSSSWGRLDMVSVRVPSSSVLCSGDLLLEKIATVFDEFSLAICAICVGIMRASLESSIKYSQERFQFGAPIGNLQAIRFKLADMQTAFDASKLMVLDASFSHDTQDFREKAFMAHKFCTESGVQLCYEGLQIHGGYGYMEEYHQTRFYRDMKVCSSVSINKTIRELNISSGS
jgi:alkylation response protein AidB-like acyl-CoA dehydrogenase